MCKNVARRRDLVITVGVEEEEEEEVGGGMKRLRRKKGEKMCVYISLAVMFLAVLVYARDTRLHYLAAALYFSLYT